MDRYLAIIREEIEKYVINEGVEVLGNYATTLTQLLSIITTLKSTDKNGKEQPELEAFLARLVVYITQIIAAVQRCVSKNVLTEDLSQYGINVPRELDAVNPAAWVRDFQRGYYNTGNFLNSTRGYGNYAAYKNRSQVRNGSGINTTIPLARLLEQYDGFLNDYNTINKKYNISSTLSSAPGSAIKEVGNLKNTFIQLGGTQQQGQQKPNGTNTQSTNNANPSNTNPQTPQNPSGTNPQNPNGTNTQGTATNPKTAQNTKKTPQKPQIDYRRYLLMLRNVNTNGHRLNGYMEKVERMPNIDDKTRNDLREILDRAWNLCDNCITAIESNSIYSAKPVNGVTSLQDLMSLNKNTMGDSNYFYCAYESYEMNNQYYGGTIDKEFPVLASMMQTLRSLYNEMKKSGTFTTTKATTNASPASTRPTMRSSGNSQRGTVVSNPRKTMASNPRRTMSSKNGFNSRNTVMPRRGGYTTTANNRRTIARRRK